MSEALVLAASGSMIYCPVAQERTNSAMGTGQTPPQNVTRLLLGWTVLANKRNTLVRARATDRLTLVAATPFRHKPGGDQSGRGRSARDLGEVKFWVKTSQIAFSFQLHPSRH